MPYNKIFPLGGSTPSGIAGAIQFSNGSAFASDATNLFWDDTNNRLGVGTNAPNTALDISASLTSIFTLRNGATNFITTRSSGIGGVDTGFRIWDNANNFTLDLYGSGSYDHAQRHRFYVGGAANERLLIGATTAATIKGSGSTSATTSLLVQNSAATALLNVRDNGSILINGLSGSGGAAGGTNFESNGNDMSFRCAYYYRFYTSGDNRVIFGSAFDGVNTYAYNENRQVIGANTINSTAQFQIDSTTRGFLPPRMTTTQKNAIASPLAGLQVYDTTTNKLCCYNGSTWNDLF